MFEKGDSMVSVNLGFVFCADGDFMFLPGWVSVVVSCLGEEHKMSREPSCHI